MRRAAARPIRRAPIIRGPDPAASIATRLARLIRSLNRFAVSVRLVHWGGRHSRCTSAEFAAGHSSDAPGSRWRRGPEGTDWSEQAPHRKSGIERDGRSDHMF